MIRLTRAFAAVCFVGLVAACGDEAPPNQAPIIAPLADTSLRAGESVVVSVAAFDADNDPISLSLKDAPAFATLDGTFLTLAPTAGDVGAHTLSLVATAAGSSATGTLTVVVTAAIDAPVVSVDRAVVELLEFKTQEIAVSVTGDEPEADYALSFVATPPAFATLGGETGRKLVLAPGGRDAGEYKIVVRATGTSGARADVSVQVTVRDVARDLELTEPEGLHVTLAEGEHRLVRIPVADPEGAVPTYSSNDLPPFASLDVEPGFIALSPGFLAQGLHTFTIIGSASPRSIQVPATIIVTATNRAPTVRPLPPVTLIGGHVVTVPVEASDPDEETLMLSLTAGPAWATIEGTSVTLAPAGSDEGMFEVTVTATDDFGDSGVTSFTVTVARLQTAPVVGTLAQTIDDEAVEPGTEVTRSPLVTAVVSDGEGDLVRFEVEVFDTAAPRGVPTLATLPLEPGAVSLQLPSLPAGAYRWAVRAVDATGRSSDWVTFDSGDEPAFRVEQATLAGSLSFEGGEFTRSRLQTLRLDVAPSPGAELSTMAFSDDGQLFGAEQAFNSTAYHLLPPLQGRRTVYARVRDSLKNEGLFSAELTYDATPPAAFARIVHIKSGAAVELIGDPAVGVQLQAGDAASAVATICLSHDPFTWPEDDCAPPPAAPADDIRAWTVNDGDGLRTVYARAVDLAGNETVVAASVRLDTTPPHLTLIANGGNEQTANTSVQLVVTASDESGVASVCYAEDDEAFDDCGAYAPVVTRTLSGADGARRIRVQAVDFAGNTTEKVSELLLDRTPPTFAFAPTTPFRQVQGVNYSVTPTVSYTLTPNADATGVTHMQFSTNDGFESAVEPFATTRVITVSSGDGAKQVTARVRDGAGNWSTHALSNFTQDRTAPVVGVDTPSFVIKNDESFTSSTTVNLSLRNISDATSGLYQVEYYNHPATSGTKETYSSEQASWTLSSGDGQKTVYARIYDRAGNVTTLSDTILLDQTVPSINARFDQAPATATATATLRYTITFPSPITEVCASNNADFSGSVCDLPVPTVSGQERWLTWTLPTSTQGTKTVWIEARRAVGQSARTSTSITYDTLAPQISAVTINGGTDLATNNRNVTVGFTTSAGTDTSALKEYCLSLTTTCTTYLDLPVNRQLPFVLPDTDGVHTIYLRLRDEAGNQSTATAATSAKITLDRAPPTFTLSRTTPSPTNDPNITLSVTSATDGSGSGLSRVRISQDGATPALVDVAYGGTTYGYKLTGTPSADGTRTLTVGLVDKAGNVTAKQVSVHLDTVAPIGTLTLGYDLESGGTKWVRGGSSSATMTTSGLARYCLKNTNDTPANNDGCWSSFRSNWPHSPLMSLTAGDGVKTVYAWFLDEAGNRSNVVSAAVRRDSSPPTLGAPVFSKVQATHHQIYVEFPAATDAGVGLNQYTIQWSYNPTGPWTSNLSIPVAGPLRDTVTGLQDDRYVYVRLNASDLLGNSGSSAASEVYLHFPFRSFQRETGTTGRFNAIARRGATAVYAVGDSGLAADSTDLGVTWKRIDMGVDATWSGVAFADQNKGVAVSASGYVGVTKDGGRTWVTKWISDFLLPVNLVDVAYLKTVGSIDTYIAVGTRKQITVPPNTATGGTIYLVNVTNYDGNETWSSVWSKPSGALTAVDTCHEGALCSNLVVAVGNSGQVVRSTDGGANWVESSIPGANFVDITRVAGTGTFAALKPGFLYVSPNGGLTFNLLHNVPAGTTYSGIAAAHLGKIHLVGSTTAGDARTVQHAVTCTSTTCNYVRQDDLWTMPTLAGLTSVVYLPASGESPFVAVGQGGSVARQGAMTQWVWMNPSNATKETMAGVSPRTTGVVWATRGPSVVRTSMPAATTPPAVAPALNAARVDPNDVLNDIHAVTDFLSFSVGRNGTQGVVVSSTGSGMPVPVRALIVDQPLHAVHCSNTFCAAVGEASMVATATGNTSAMTNWQRTSSFAGTTFRDVAVVHPSGSARMYMVGDNGSAGVMYEATQSGSTLNLTAPPTQKALGITVPPLRALSINGNTWIAAGNTGTIIRSTNGGSTWARVTTGTSVTLHAIAVDGTKWLVGGAAGTLLVSTDDGATWTQLNTLSSVDLFDVGFGRTSNELWASGASGTLIYSQTGGY